MANVRGKTIIKIGGKKREVKFGINQTAIYNEITGTSLNDFNLEVIKLSKGEGTGAIMRDILYSGLAAACLSNKIEVDFNKIDVGDWMDDLRSEDFKNIFTAIADSMGTKTNKPKKKVTEKS